MVNEDSELPNVVTDGKSANHDFAPLDIDDGEALEICIPLDGEETPLPDER